MAQQQVPAAPSRARHAEPNPPVARQADRADPVARLADAAVGASPNPGISRWAITRGHLLMLLVFFLPAMASMLAPVLTEDVSYQVRVGQLTLEAGRVIDTDPFTFTVFGEPWLNQQWGASVIFAAVYDGSGWLGLLLLRAVLIGLAFALVYAACRANQANRIVASLTTLGMFVVAATNLALRSQMFGVVCFAAVVAILAWRRKHPLLLWLIPLIMILWANTHGSFVVGWAAIALAALEDLVARRRLALVTIVVGLLSVLATLVHPWGVAMWAYVLELSTNPLITALVTEWQAATLKTPTGIFFYVSVAVVLALLLYRGRTISWLQVAWLAGLALLSLMAVRNVVWWAIGAAPVVALLVSRIEVRGVRMGDPGLDRPRGVGYTAIALVAGVLALAVLPVWKPIDSRYGPEGVVRNAPRGVTEVLLAVAGPTDRLYAEQKWGSWFELTLPAVPVMVDTRIELFDEEVWGDYLHVQGGRSDWADILDRWQVSLVAIAVDDSPLRPFIGVSEDWELLHEDDEGAVYRRVDDATDA